MYTNDQNVPTVKLKYEQSNGFVTARQQGFFIKGPLPMEWMSKAALLPGKAIQVALALWWLAGMKPQQKIKVTRQALNFFNVSNDAYRDALLRLELSGLVKVSRLPGQRAQVEIVTNITQER